MAKANPLNVVHDLGKIGRHYYRPDVARPSMDSCTLCGQDSSYGKHVTVPSGTFRRATEVV